MEGISPDFILELYLQGQTPQAVFIPCSSADRRASSRNNHYPRANPHVPITGHAQACLPAYNPPSRQASDTEDSNETFVADKMGTEEKEKSHLSQVRSALIIRRSTFNRDVQQYNIFSGEQLTIGRKETCDVVIDHPKVSRYHAAISVLPRGDTYLSITGSKSVTVNETRYAPGQSNNLIYLNKGDEINIVSETFEVAEVSKCRVEATKTAKRELASSTPKSVNPCFTMSQVAKKASCEWASRGKKTGMFDTPPPPYNSPIPVGINDVSHLHYPTPIKYTFNQTRDPEEDLDEPFAPLRETQSIFHGNSTQTSIPQSGKFQHHFPPPTKINQREMHHDQGERRPMENKKPIFRLDHVQSAWTDTNANFVPRRQPNQSLQGQRGLATVDDRLPLRKSWNKSESGDRRQKKMYVPEGFPSIDVLEHESENPLPKSRFQPLTSMVGRNSPTKFEGLPRSKKRNKLASGGVPCSPPGNHDVVSLRNPRKNLSQSCSDEDDDPDVIVEGTRLLTSDKKILNF